ncbi:MAG TPA: TraM recognition domain-containing protein [Aggregatilineaceae bacterium]|nr:TraM recognition domain-containing protein [Aggregatilineaceae bacterium]
MVGAQTKGQFHMIYGTEGTQALFTGLATQIVYGGCDHDTADYYSKASGTTTADANPDPAKANFRQRPLLTVDEVVTPQIGNCTIFARYVEPAFATQVILTARLTRLYEREDWKTRFATSKDEEPLLLERGVSVKVQPTFTPPEPPKPPKKDNQDSFAQAAKQRMAEAKTGKAKVSDESRPTMTDIRTMKRRAEQQRQTAKAQMEGEDATR